MTKQMWNYFDRIVELKIADDILYQEALTKHKLLLAKQLEMKELHSPHKYAMTKITKRWEKVDEALEEVYNFIKDDKLKNV